MKTLEKIIILIIIALIAFSLCSCNDSKKEKQPDTPKIEIKVPPGMTELDAYRNELARVRGEKKELALREANLVEQIKTKETEQVKWWSNVIGSVCIGIAALCLVASFFLMSYPILPTVLRYISYSLGSCGFLAFVFAALYSYFFAIGLAILAILLITAAWLWFSDRRALRQVVSVVEEHKNSIPDYKNKFRAKIDAKADNWLNKVRGK